ncbi:hypothetical protein DICSQDRAFT_89248 [Dichomitus squalens LYAD-421 SS1]|uniref:RTA1 like protein-domain-containing protein n=2 Tax=Dichomitus squalens TaxID=114155 RepID=A0A4Q9MWM7_9APHY|nr:uncharacterized protein DICSQDRAFT_89248 [Dichomitus squalens LYAD-421 SS1]EJF59596.1 hypothetical protein DICSQDRAFT_89248 [Dichomitus squalens LYAD-421 SS1]TBU32484.1 hypothetical protein BD311DRAFT_775139 [Dichomitus squalens]
MVHLTDDLAALIGFAGEATLWGAYAILFLVSIVLMRKRKQSTPLSLPVVVAHVALFIACTVHYGLEFNHFYTTLAAKGVHGYANETTQLVGADIFLSLCDLLGDYILIYRLWVLWGRNYWIIILPSLCAVAGFTCIMVVVHYVVTLDPTSPTPPAAMLPLTIAGYALPLGTNALATVLIIGRIWWLSRPMPGVDASLFAGRSIARNAISTIVESGLLYFAAQLTYVVTLSIPHPSEGVIAVMALQIYGIAPTLIIIRVMLGLSIETTTKGAPVTPMVWASRGYSTQDSRAVKYGVALGSGNTAASSTKVYQADGESVEMKPLEEV